MKVVLFGATGMVGQGVLRECLLDEGVTEVLSVSRTPIGKTHEKLKEILHEDFYDFTPIASDLAGYDACFFCLGISSAGMSEQEYRRITYDITMAAAKVLAEKNPQMTFVYVSGAGTGGSSMWARVKAETEQALLAMPFARKVMFRPAAIQPTHGTKSKTRLYRAVYFVMGPLFFLLKGIAPKWVTTNELVARAMIDVARNGSPKEILENIDINEIAKRLSTKESSPRS